MGSEEGQHRLLSAFASSQEPMGREEPGLGHWARRRRTCLLTVYGILLAASRAELLSAESPDRDARMIPKHGQEELAQEQGPASPPSLSEHPWVPGPELLVSLREAPVSLASSVCPPVLVPSSTLCSMMRADCAPQASKTAFQRASEIQKTNTKADSTQCLGGLPSAIL